MAFSSNAAPCIISGRGLKSINQFYNKERARLQSFAKVYNDRYTTNRIYELTQERNNKVNDFLHKASRKVVELALINHVGTIVIGHIQGWKQKSPFRAKENQSFVGIPFNTFFSMIEYKAALVGIKVVIIDEGYTSGTSYLDKELPCIENYNKKRRKKRGLFIADTGEKINADVNAAYQIIKKYDESRFRFRVKHNEPITMIYVS